MKQERNIETETSQSQEVAPDDWEGTPPIREYERFNVKTNPDAEDWEEVLVKGKRPNHASKDNRNNIEFEIL